MLGDGNRETPFPPRVRPEDPEPVLRDPRRHRHDGGAGAMWRRLGGAFLLALVNNGFNILKADRFYRDPTTGLVIFAAIGIGVSGGPR